MILFGRMTEIGEPEAGDLVLRNFHQPEQGGFVWSAGSWCEIEFSAPLSNAGPPPWMLELDLDVYREPRQHPSQTVFIYLNGHLLITLNMFGRQVLSLNVSPRIFYPDTNTIVVDTPDATRPTDFGGTDHRMLGIRLHAIGLRAGT